MFSKKNFIHLNQQKYHFKTITYAFEYVQILQQRKIQHAPSNDIYVKASLHASEYTLHMRIYSFAKL